MSENISLNDNNFCYDNKASLVICKEAIEKNICRVRECTNKKIIAVIKENGYGLGIANYYSILKDLSIDMYAVTAVSEALALRREGCTDDILMLTPISDFEELVTLVINNVIIALGNDVQILKLVKIAELTGRKARVHIQIDSGMGRYGFSADDIPNFKNFAEYISVEGCFSHFAGSTKNYRKSVKMQIDIFRKSIAKIESDNVCVGMRHICNSKATFTYGDMGFDAVRVGSGLIGKVPSADGLTEATWMESEVFSTYYRPKGETIGYGGEVALKRDSKLAIIRIGTASGIGLCQRGANACSIIYVLKNIYKRLFAISSMNVWINGVKCPVIGRLGVSHMTVDVTDCDVNEGDIVKIGVNPIFVHPSIKRIIV